jgi:hypothetical protein
VPLDALPGDFKPAPDLKPMGCTTSTECPDDMPICANQVCRTCTGDAEDGECAKRTGAKRCLGGRCVACRPSTQLVDCTTQQPVCTTEGACRKCQAHNECSSLVCQLVSGECARIDQVDRGQEPLRCAPEDGGTQPRQYRCAVATLESHDGFHLRLGARVSGRQ